MQQHPLLAPVFAAGKEPLPPGMTEEERANILQVKKYQDYMSVGMESCLGKTVIAGVAGFGLGGFFLFDVFILRVRGPTSKTKSEHYTEDNGDIQRYGSRYVEERKGVWEGRGVVRRDRVRHRIVSSTK